MRYPADKLSTFAIELPEDSSLVPVLLRLLHAHTATIGFMHDMPSAPGRNVAAFEFLRQYSESAKPFIDLASDGESPILIRASSAILAFLHPDGGLTALESTIEVILTACTEDSESRFLNLFTFFLGEVSSPENAFVENIIKRLFETNRHNYAARASLESLISRWAEISFAPVTSSKYRDSWLGVQLS